MRFQDSAKKVMQLSLIHICGFIAFNVISSVIPIIMSIASGFMTVIKVVRVLSMLMMANPIMIAITAIAAAYIY